MINEYVYIIDFGKFRKIGYSTNPEIRIKTISRKLGMIALDSFVINITNARELEKKLLVKFNKSIVKGLSIKKELVLSTFVECIDAINKFKKEVSSLPIKNRAEKPPSKTMVGVMLSPCEVIRLEIVTYNKSEWCRNVILEAMNKLT